MLIDADADWCWLKSIFQTIDAIDANWCWCWLKSIFQTIDAGNANDPARGDHYWWLRCWWWDNLIILSFKNLILWIIQINSCSVKFVYLLHHVGICATTLSKFQQAVINRWQKLTRPHCRFDNKELFPFRSLPGAKCTSGSCKAGEGQEKDKSKTLRTGNPKLHRRTNPRLAI